MSNKFIELKQDVDKLDYALEYDIKEMARLRSDMEYALDIDVDKNKEGSLIDKLLALSAKRVDRKNLIQTKKEHSAILEAIDNQNDYTLMCLTCNIIARREKLAEARYQLRNLMAERGASTCTSTLTALYHQINNEVNDYKLIVGKIKTYLSNKYSTATTYAR